MHFLHNHIDSYHIVSYHTMLTVDYLLVHQSSQLPSWHKKYQNTDHATHAGELLRSLFPKLQGTDEKTYEIGRTKVYFSSTVLQALESTRSQLIFIHIETIQKVYRGHVVYKWFQMIRKSVITIQAYTRRYHSNGLVDIYSLFSTLLFSSLLRHILIPILFFVIGIDILCKAVTNGFASQSFHCSAPVAGILRSEN
jgi:hypothetical protein